MGTFIIRPTSQNSGGTPQYNSSGPFPNDAAGWFTEDYPVTPLLDVIKDTVAAPSFLQIVAFTDGAPNSYDNTLRLSFSGDCIYLDGSLTPISFAGLPAGFNPLTASIKIITDAFINNVSYYLQHASGNDGTVNTDDYPYDFGAFPTPTMLDIISNGCGLRVSFNLNIGESGQVTGVYNLRIEGTYDLQAFPYDWTNDTPDVDPRVDKEVTITSTNGGLDTVVTDDTDITTNPNFPDENNIFGNPNGKWSGITLVYGSNTYTIPSESIIEQTADELIFEIDYWFILWILLLDPMPEKEKKKKIEAELKLGTRFSGSVSLGTLTIVIADASGIYRFVSNQTHDVVYFRDGYTTFPEQLRLYLEDDLIEDDFFSLMDYPYKILSESYMEDEDEEDKIEIIGLQEFVAIPYDIEIPTPSIETAFTP